MNYSKSIKKTSIGRRILISWLIIAVIFSGVGYGIAWLIPKEKEDVSITDSPTSEPEKEILIYGRYDGRIFEGEMSREWMQGDLNFVPLDVPLHEDIQEFVFYLSAGYNIDFTLAMALMQHESSFRVEVISKTNDYGLMQINTCNHEWLSEQLGITDYLDPYDNIRAGMFILRKLFEKYETPEKVLMAYNMGETGASRLWEQGIFEINYSKNIMQIQQEFHEELERKGIQND